MRHLYLVLPLIALAAACNQQPAPPPQASTTPTATASASAAAPAITPTARRVDETNALYEFTYAYPAQAGAIEALKAHFDRDIEDERSTLIASAKEEKDGREDADFEYQPLSFSKDWKVVTDLPGWLSLSTIIGSYMGGAHPNYVFDTLLWDKSAGVQRVPADLFTSKEVLGAVIETPFCAALDKAREKKRGEPVVRDPDDWMAACIDPTEQTVILGSSNGKTFDRIGVLVAPYAAGPYAEGDYEVTLPVTREVLAAVRPQYRASFSLGR